MRVPYRKKRSRHKISLLKKPSVKNLVTGKKFRHFLLTNIFAWLSENINCIFSLLVYLIFKKAQQKNINLL